MLSLFLAISVVIAQQPPHLKGLDVLGSGLDPLVGNMDPLYPTDYYAMFRFPVFNIEWTQNLTTRDGLWSIPDNTTADLLPVCSFTQAAVQVTCSLDYYEWASLYIEEDKDFLFFSSSKSASYSEYVKITTSMSNYAYIGDSICLYYKIGFLPDTQEVLSSYFIQDVASLPVTYTSLNDYETWFTNYGTHVLIDMDMGGRYYQTTQVSSFNFTYLESQSIDVEAEAGVGFLVSAGMDFEGQGQQQTYITFSKYSQKGILECMGGDVADCGNWTAWAPTVNSNPIPVRIQLELIYKLLTPAYFPNDPKIAARQLALAQATQAYLLGNQNVPEQYLADVSAQAGIANHITRIPHQLQTVPTYVNLQFATFPDRTNTSSSKYFMVDFAFDMSYSGNPLSVQATDTQFQLSIYGATYLFGAWNGGTGLWTEYKSGWWAATLLKQAPTWGGNWVQKNSLAQEAVTLITGITANDITLFQVQFAQSANPTVVYPLIWRESSNQAPTCVNPVAITIEYGIVQIQLLGGYPLFAVYNNDDGPWQWSYFNSNGFFRANAFTIAPNFNSNWVPAYQTKSVQAIYHGLKVIPQIVQVFFSPDTTGAKVYPVTWNYGSGAQPNPLGIYADQLNVYISIQNGVVWSSWYAANSTWTHYTTGYWKVTCWISSPEPQTYSLEQKI